MATEGYVHEYAIQLGELRVTNAAAALAIYEYLITFGQEVTAVWKKRMNASSLLLLSVRWAMVVYAVMSIATAKPQEYAHSAYLQQCTLTLRDCDSCKPIEIIYQVINFVMFIQTALFSALRVFAMSGRGYSWAVVVGGLGLMPVATNMYTAIMASYGYSDAPVSSCGTYLDVSPIQFNFLLAHLVLYLTRGSLVLADAMVIVLTWIKTFRQWQEGRRLKIPVSISTCLLRDGTWFFLVMLAMNTVHRVTANDTSGIDPMDELISVLPSILINRFMLNLRSLDDGASQGDSDAHHFSRFSAPHFRIAGTFNLGYIGEEIEHADGVMKEIDHAEGDSRSMP